MVQTIQRKYPNAEVICGTMDEFYRELSKYDLSNIPIITKDLADTWIHGVGTYPQEVGIIRNNREISKRLQAILTKQVLEGVNKNSDKIDEKLDQYYEAVNLFEEHTWGADVKTWLGSDRVYQKKDFLERKKQEEYRFIEASWQEQRDRAIQSRKTLNKLKILVENDENDRAFLFNPNNSEYTGWVFLQGLEQMNFHRKMSEFNLDFIGCGVGIKGELLPMTKIDGEWACYVENVPPFVTVPIQFIDALPQRNNLLIQKQKSIIKVENHRYVLVFEEASGNIRELYDKKMNVALLKSRNEKAVFAYQYDCYGSEDITDYLKNYAYRFSDWGIKDFGRENYPECEHRTYQPIFQSYSIEMNTISFFYQTKESAQRYGDAEGIRLEVTLPPEGEELFVSIHLTNKNETPYVESGTLLFPFAQESAQYKINKSNNLVDVSTDIQMGANHVFYCIENFITLMNGRKGLCIIAKDTPLISLGETGILKYRNEYKEPVEPVTYFNLFNNMWGTNFPQWIGGDLTYRYILFGIEKSQEEIVMERAAVLCEGVELTGTKLEKDLTELPEHMQLINARNKNGGLVLRFKDLAGKEAQRRICVKDYDIMPVDLNNIAIGMSCSECFEFSVKPYGVYSFQLTKQTSAIY
jgi:hypothetical protein